MLDDMKVIRLVDGVLPVPRAAAFVAIPEWAGRLVAMTEFDGRLIVACESAVFRLAGDVLEPIEFQKESH